MNNDEYLEMTRQTAIYPKEIGVTYCTLGLVGEAGEIANKVKKVIRDDNGQLSASKREELIDELGDFMWYAFRLADELNIPIESVLYRNAQNFAAAKKGVY